MVGISIVFCTVVLVCAFFLVENAVLGVFGTRDDLPVTGHAQSSAHLPAYCARCWLEISTAGSRPG